jgi:hypothetical protein
VRGRLFPVGGNWYEWRPDRPLGASVFVHVVVGEGGRLVVDGLRIDGPPTAELLRAIPVGKLEATANAQLAVVDDAVVAVKNRRPRPVRPPAADPGGWETSDPAAAVGRRLPEPAGRGRPDHFYREVATVYLDYAQGSHRPAVDLAERHDVPVTTAHRWIKEARRRGFLPPGRPGRAG